MLTTKRLPRELNLSRAVLVPFALIGLLKASTLDAEAANACTGCPEYALCDELDEEPLLYSGSTTKAVVLVHGWNPANVCNKYTDPGWSHLIGALKGKLRSTDWKLITYHWERGVTGANTGAPWNCNYSNCFDLLPPKNAAVNAAANATVLASFLREALPGLRQVHFIAHSAGSWAARGALTELLSTNSNLIGQMTLLDPFVPDTLGGSTGLNYAAMNATASSPNSGRVAQLDAYCADDEQVDSNSCDSAACVWLSFCSGGEPSGFGTVGTPGGYGNACAPFSWRANDLSMLQVDWGQGYHFTGVPILGVAQAYDCHSGPLSFYADSIQASYAFPLTSDIRNPAWNTNASDWTMANIGWKRSLFYKEELQRAVITRISPSSPPISSSPQVISISGSNFNPPGGPNASIVRFYDPQNAMSVCTPTSGSSTSLGCTLTVGSKSGTWKMIVANGAIDSLPFSFVVPASGAGLETPSSLTAVPVSSTQINLTWNYNSSNEWGFSVERRAPSTEWAEIATRAAGVKHYSDLNRTPGVQYQYQVRAYNIGYSAFSNVAYATTSVTAPSYHTLYLRSSNPSSGVLVQTWVNNSQYAANLTPTMTGRDVGARVGVACQQSLSSGFVFQRWTLDGVDYDYNNPTAVTLDRDMTLTAVYGPMPSTSRTLSSVSIQGPSSVDERTTATYTAVSKYSDGSSEVTLANWDSDSSYGTFSAPGVLDTSAVSSDREIEISATVGYYGVVIEKTKDVTIRNTDVIPTYTLNRSASNGSIGRSPSMSAYPSGTEVRLSANPDDGYEFSHWSGNASGTSRTTYITMNSNKSVTANFTESAYGAIRVMLSPQAAIDDGAGWKQIGKVSASDWQASGATFHSLVPGTYTVRFNSLPNWLAPDYIKVSVQSGPTTVVHAPPYQEIKGSVQAVLTPDAANTAGARWRLDGGAWTEGGVVITNVSTGSHTIDFLAVSGWASPPSQQIGVQRHVTFLSYGNYTPPAGLPIITSISPKTGPLAGGTVVTIDGTNFAPNSTVTFGGVSATQVTYVSSSQLRATSPARQSYGTVALAVQSNGQIATQSNGFSYLVPLGANIDLVGQFGGDVWAVAVVGDIAYYGEGTSLVVSDFSTPASPIERGRIALPFAIQDIAVANNVAFVADGFAGLYAVDVSTPTAPAIMGFFDTPNSAQGVAVLGSRAYVADARSLRILDVSNPAAMFALGFLSVDGWANQVAVGTIGQKTYAFVSEGESLGSTPVLHVIDVTTPEAPVEVASIFSPDSNFGFIHVRLVGTKLYVSDNGGGGLRIFDVADPTNPLQVGVIASDRGGEAFFDASATRVYACHSGLRVFDSAILPTPPQIGVYDPVSCYDLVVANNLAFAAAGSSGLVILNVSNPSSISQQSLVKTIGGIGGVYAINPTVLVGAEDGLYTVDVSTPAKPARLGVLPGSPIRNLVAADGKATLVTRAGGVSIIDITNPAAPSPLGAYSPSGATTRHASLMGSIPVLAGSTSPAPHFPRVDVLNISNPSSPQSTGSVIRGNLQGTAHAMTIAGTWGFVGTSGVGNNSQATVDVVDLTNPTSPQLTASFPTPFIYFGIAATNDASYLYIPTGSGIQVIDMRVKTAPVTAAIIAPPQAPSTITHAVHVSGDRLYASVGGFLFAFDITNPASPAMLGYYDIPSWGDSISTAGDLILVADASPGVVILKLRDIDQPTVAITSPTTNSTYATGGATVTLSGVATDNQSVERVVWNNDRGGGGVAVGTTAWSIADIQLASGLNRVTVTAGDAGGNYGSDVIEVTATFPDTTAPVVSITGPKHTAEFTVETESIELTGSVADNVGVASVAWSNDRGGAGQATHGIGAWSVTEVPLALGPNLLEVTATDSAGNSATDSALVFMAPPDTEPPTITIDFPTPNAELYAKEGVLNISGTAFDNVGIDRIEWAAGEGLDGLAEGASPWFVNGIVLEPGLNVIDVTVYDGAGNSSVDTLAVTFDSCAGADGDGNCSESFNALTESCDAPDPNGSACDDGLFCNGADTCSGGTCSNHAGDPCGLGAECANTCNEAADTCFNVTGTACSTDANPCTLDQCDGLGACVHPAGNAGTVCRPSAGACDTAEVCSGTSTSCPTEAFATSTTICRAASGVCDVQETCTGTTTSCPANSFTSSATVCRSAGGICDVPESCNGLSATCPGDALVASTTICRGSIGECDLPENCTGASKACPDNAFVANNTGCSTDNNVCTNDVCNGLGTCTHPANSAACNDGIFCNGADTCAGGTCSNHAGNPCPGPDGDGNCAESCSEAADSCTALDPETSPCNDGDPCTSNDVCTAGTCAGSAGEGCATTTTTMPSDQCGDPNGDGKITASDALAALGAAVGSRACALWICDFNGDGRVSAADALAILRTAVGQEVSPQCPEAEALSMPSTIIVPTTIPMTATTLPFEP